MLGNAGFTASMAASSRIKASLTKPMRQWKQSLAFITEGLGFREAKMLLCKI